MENFKDAQQPVTEFNGSFEGESLVSILLYDYYGSALGCCLDSIFTQQHLNNFEVVIADDASTDGAWQIAQKYSERHPGKLTLSRNKIPIGEAKNLAKGIKLCTGEYCVNLTVTSEYHPTYVVDVIGRMKADPFFRHTYIHRLNRGNPFIPRYSPIKNIKVDDAMQPPLVTLCIFNYNYGRYLRQCFDSAFAQTYQNIEVCFSDNASTDDSWEIALEYAERYPGKVNLTRNRMNFGPNINLYNCILTMRGKYMLKLCSDDAIRPRFIEQCVMALETYQEAAFAMVHRDIMDDKGNITPEPSFYDQSCLIPGSEQAAVYMMSSVNASISQILYNLSKAEGKRMAGNLNDRWFGDRIMDFHMCCDAPIVYLKESLLLNRVHGLSDGAAMDGNLLQCMGEYVLLHQLADIAGHYSDMQSAQTRLQPGLDKLGCLCLRYCLRCLAGGDSYTAKRYYHLSAAIFPGVAEDANYRELNRYWTLDSAGQEVLLKELLGNINQLRRTVSYQVPPGSVPLFDIGVDSETSM